MSDTILEDSLNELLSFLTESAIPDVRRIAAEHLVGLTLMEDGRALIGRKNDCIIRLAELSGDQNPAIVHPILQLLVNLSTDEELSTKLLCGIHHAEKLLCNLLEKASEERTDSCSIEIQDTACMALSNLTRHPICCRTVWDYIQLDENCANLKKLVIAACRDIHSVNHLAMLLCNLSQLEECRRKLMDKEFNLIGRLLPLLNYTLSDIRRKGVVGVIRNCCFDSDHHDWLLGDEVDLLTALAYPLAGPEEFEEDEMAQLPIELQYLGQDKQRESNPEIRKMLIEAINQLCAKPEGRRIIREQRVYLILRELHKWETVDEVITACENLVDILIADEPEPGMGNLKQVTIPDNLLNRFNTELLGIK